MRFLPATNIEYVTPKRFPSASMWHQERHPERCLTRDQVRSLLSSRVLVEEKIQGSPRSFEAADQFYLFAVDMLPRRATAYRVPGRYAVFDAFDFNLGVFLFSEDKAELFRDLRLGVLRVEGVPREDFFPVPVVAEGMFNDAAEILHLAGTSAYAVDPRDGTSVQMAGLVVKPDRQLYPEEQLRGRIDLVGGTGGASPPPDGRNIIIHGMPIVIRYDPYVTLGKADFSH
ncbi:MAG: hypothetical protein AB1657_01615 [Candidatus Micrarchaeota archaeon]